LGIVHEAGLTGIASSKIAVAASCNIETVSRHIRDLRAAGLIEPSRKAGVSMRWGPPGTWAHHEADRGRASLEQRKRDRRKSDKLAAVSFADRPIVRLLVKAADCPPMVKPGPSSVFEVARWAA
jgi:DNA-binding transcriptional ArsR family regulator